GLAGGPRRRDRRGPARPRPRRRPRDRRDGEGDGRARRAARRRGRRAAVHHRARVPERPGSAAGLRRLLADPVLEDEHGEKPAPWARPRFRSPMYDALTAQYTFGCPVRGSAAVPLSSFRRLERLPGTSHPVVYRVAFNCTCGDEHLGLVGHDDLDWAPLGLAGMAFANLMTARMENADAEFGDAAARRIGAGEWPWSFFCYPEQRP